MTEPELIRQISIKTGRTIKSTKETIDGFKAVLLKTLQDDESVMLTSLGKFKTFVRHERNGWNPIKHEVMQVPEVRIVKFRTAPNLRKQIRKTKINASVA